MSSRPCLYGGFNAKDRLRTDRYLLTMRQQPIAARACGFGERDRRVIDPPPIVQLSLRDFNPKSSADIAELRWPLTGEGGIPVMLNIFKILGG